MGDDYEKSLERADLVMVAIIGFFAIGGMLMLPMPWSLVWLLIWAIIYWRQTNALLDRETRAASGWHPRRRPEPQWLQWLRRRF